jgi:hypothetical protein
MSSINKYLYKSLFLLIPALLVLSSCEEEEVYEQTRLFRPVLNEQLRAELNTIIVNMGKMKEVSSYTLEVSRDTFQTIDYLIETTENYVEINATLLNGEELLWNTLYQVRATAHANDPIYDSKPSDLGNVRTERFPSILNVPTSADVIDRAARVTWQSVGAQITAIKVFAITDARLSNPLREREVSAEEHAAGLAIVSGLEPLTSYQLAIYSGATLRGWETYTTKEGSIDLNDPSVINLTESEDPDAVINAVATASEGQIIVVKKGVVYNLPSVPLDKSITIRGSQGFGSEKAVLYTTGNWNIAGGATVDHVRFIDLELRGADIGGDYVFNPSNSAPTYINELTFDDCILNNFRGIIRIRSKVFLNNYTINNSIVYRIGGYGIITTDTDGDGNAAVNNIYLTNSTFSKINSFMTSRQNAQSIVIDGCTMNELATPDGIVFRWRGTDGERSNVLNGISITNTIWGPAWDEAATGKLSVRGIYDGLEATSFNIVNTYATSDFSFTPGSEIPGFPALNYSGTPTDLWVDPANLDFNFKDSGFAGKFDTGDPRWRAKL